MLSTINISQIRLRGDRMNPVRTIERIIKAPDIHWVGTGFRVRQYFPDSDESPMLDRNVSIFVTRL